MILYRNSAEAFIRDTDENQIAREIESAYVQHLRRKPHYAERTAWINSMQFMERIIRNARVPGDCGILIEYKIPSTSKRIDFIIAGHDDSGVENFIIVELKQWSDAEASDKPDLVRTILGGGRQETIHPSYQAFSYRQFLMDMNEAIYSGDIRGHSCAYLHNYHRRSPEPLEEARYQPLIRQAPLFLADDGRKLQAFLRKYVGRGRGMDLLYHIEHGRIRPSRKLIDHVIGLFEGNAAFTLLDEQKVAYETIMRYAAQGDRRRTIIVKGGPGTGKSVISMNALGGLLSEEKNVIFVAPNAAFRDVMVTTLAGPGRSKTRLRSVFHSSASLYDARRDRFDVIIVDEAHRLKGKEAFMYRGDNQVEDVIRSSFVNVFFIDDTQRVRPEDIGSVAEIRRIAKAQQAEVIELDLVTQFRCAGAEGYVNWLDDVLQIRETANFDGWDREAYTFRLVDSPHTLVRMIEQRIAEGHRARLLAGYAWPWTSEKDGNPSGEIDDVAMQEHDFSMPWNARSSRSTWAIDASGVHQVGCIHTSQGLEFDYAGVIIGNDLRFDPARMELYADYDAYHDRPGKRGLKSDNATLTTLVKNIYRVLMSRGMKGCYVFARDPHLRNYLRHRLEQATTHPSMGSKNRMDF